MKKIIGILCLAAVSAMAVKANRIGPVSTYGELKAKGGKLVGSCAAYSDKAVQVKGMSLFWSTGAEDATKFYDEKGINHLVDDMNVEIIRFAMGVGDEKFNSSKRSYTTGGESYQKAMLQTVVETAVAKDVYVIIDWHIEKGDGYTDDAVKFFEYAAQKYGKYNNVIFEIWNEPVSTDMRTVATHAQSVIDVIRKYSDNLVLVGSPEWSSHPEQCAEAGISDANYGCSLHFYAAYGPHQIDNNGQSSFNKRAESAISKGVPVFATEWGSVLNDGKGDPNSTESDKWISWMTTNGVSWTYWNASAVHENGETASAFSNSAFDRGFNYSASGNYIKNKFSGKTFDGKSYTDCGLVNGTAEETTPFSSGVAKGTKTSMIDDMEDGDRYNYIGGGWNAFDDTAPDNDGHKGNSSLTNAKIKDDFGKDIYDVILPAEEGNSSNYMVGIKGIKLSKGNLSYSPYVAIGLDLKKDTTVFADFKNCTTIRYKYKGASHNFRIETTDVTNYNYHRVNKDNSKDWREVKITIPILKQETWSASTNADIIMEHATRLAWEVKAPDGVPEGELMQPIYDYLYIDDVSCDGLSITANGGEIINKPKSSASVSGNSSSSAATIQSSASQVEVKLVKLIDDVEDGNEVLETTGTWYAYTDKEPGGKSSITNVYDNNLPGYVVVFPGTEDATNGTNGFVGLKGIVWDQGTYGENPFAALGINTMSDTTKGLDMSACGGISYRYKGSKHIFKVQDGQVTDYGYHQNEQTDAAGWTTVVLSWDDIEQPSWAEEIALNTKNIKKMSWEVVGYKGFSVQPTTDYLYVDDLKCVEIQTGIRMARKAASSLKLSVNGEILNVVTTSAARIQVFDMMGNLVMNRVANAAGNHHVSLEGMNRGNYVVRVKSVGAAQTARISIR